jgi:hypothetical protein
MYYDVAVLTIDGRLPKPVDLASADELGQLEDGLPLACFGYTHDASKISRFDQFQPQLWRGKIYLITTPPALPGHPRLLHVRSDVAQFAYGSPLVNAQGKVVAMYVDRAGPLPGQEAPTGAAGLKDLHYATVLNPESIRRWTEYRDAKLWVPPPAGAANQP